MRLIFRLRGFAPAQQQFANSVAKVEEETAEASRQSILAVQDNVVPRIPVDTGETRDAFADPDAIGQGPGGVWQFGLLTDDLVRRGYKGKWIEFGTKGHAGIPALPSRPFLRPGSEATHSQIIALQRAAIQDAIDRQARELSQDGWFSVFGDSANAWQREAFKQNLREGLGLAVNKE